jgi:hypothetical protein
MREREAALRCAGRSSYHSVCTQLELDDTHDTAALSSQLRHFSMHSAGAIYIYGTGIKQAAGLSVG